IPTSLQACGIIFPFAVPTSICRNKLTICSAVYFFPRPISSSSHTSLPHIHWYKICRALHLATAEFGFIVKVRHFRQVVDLGQRGDDLLVDLVANVGLALEGDHVFEAGTWRDGDWGVGHASVFVTYVLDKQQDEDVVLVLAGIHAAAKFVAAGP